MALGYIELLIKHKLVTDEIFKIFEQITNDEKYQDQELEEALEEILAEGSESPYASRLHELFEEGAEVHNKMELVQQRN